MSTLTLDKRADLAGPGIGDYNELEKALPRDYHSLLTPKERQRAIFHVTRYIKDNLCKELNLMMVEVPLIVDVESGVDDMLDRDGSRTPVQVTSPTTAASIRSMLRLCRPRPTVSTFPTAGRGVQHRERISTSCLPTNRPEFSLLTKQG